MIDRNPQTSVEAAFAAWRAEKAAEKRFQEAQMWAEGDFAFFAFHRKANRWDPEAIPASAWAALDRAQAIMAEVGA